MKIPFCKTSFLLVCGLFFCTQARILMVVDTNFYISQTEYEMTIDTYLNDIQTIDHKPAELILWKTASGYTEINVFRSGENSLFSVLPCTTTRQ